MNFKRERLRDPYLSNTQVENIFIAEYMPGAEGNDIKVYLTALMYADSEDISNSLIAKHLGITEEDVLAAWNRWEACGAIKKHYADPKDRFHYSVEFVCLKDRLFGAKQETEQQIEDIPYEIRDQLDDSVIKETFDSIQEITGRLLEGKEPETVISWIYEDGLEPNLICFAYSFCVQRRGTNRFSYVSAVLKEWIRENIRTKEDAEKFLEGTDLRHNQYKRVMKALGFHRNPTEAEQAKIDAWFDQMGFGIDRILEACAKTSGISNPNINYVNSILSSWSNGGKKPDGSAAGVSADSKNAVNNVKKLYEEQRTKNSIELDKRRESTYKSIPRIRDIDNELLKASVELSRTALLSGRPGRISADSLRKKISDLNEEKTQLLNANQLPANYLEPQYECKECQDTGVLENGERCKCFSEKLKLFIKGAE